jgi:hypothetical protein
MHTSRAPTWIPTMLPSARFLAVICLAACTSTRGPLSTDATDDAVFRVAVMGDLPYHAPAAPNRDSIMAAYQAVLDTIAAEPVAFVVHVGDITGATCSDSLYAQRLREFSAMPHPFFYTFGDNEWTDCARDGFEPLERLAKLREVFTPGTMSLGRRTMRLERQSSDPRHAAYRENVRWQVGRVLFLTLHVVGSNNNRGREAQPSAEFTQRMQANLQWLGEAFARATDRRLEGVAIFMQANPSLTPGSVGGQPAVPSGFTDLLAELERLARSFDGHVALIHGDTHTFRVDQTMRDARGRIMTNVTRAETYGNPSFHALIMTVHPGSASFFRFQPLIIRGNTGR